MPAALSAYLDLVRAGAALIVLLSHAWLIFVPRHPLPWPAHQAVIIFFVLSGLVIAYVTSAKENVFSLYLLSRAARILSVTVPALFLAAAIALYIGEPAAQVWRETILNFFFVAQNWSLDVMAQAVQPFWSLCYEVWYYAIFAAAVFPRGVRAKLAWTVLLSVLAGPKILVLMPCWLCGVALFYYAGKVRLGSAAAGSMLALSIAGFALFYWFDISVAIRGFLNFYFPGPMESLDASNQFVGDYILALVVSANFLAVYHLRGAVSRWLVQNKRLFGIAASNTLSLYLYHYPVVVLLQHLGVANWTGIALTIAACLALAPFTEHRRYRLRQAMCGAVTRTRAVFS